MGMTPAPADYQIAATAARMRGGDDRPTQSHARVSGAHSAFPKTRWTMLPIERCMRRSPAGAPSGCRRLRGAGTPPDQIRGTPCHLLKINHPPNCARGRFMPACSPKISNTMRYGNAYRFSRPSWTRRRTLSKLPLRLMMSDAVTA